jgi:hypothetical protein
MVWKTWNSGSVLVCLHIENLRYYHNSNLGLMIKARACKDASQRWSPGITFHAPMSVRKCEGMNPHTPKWVLTLGVGVSWTSEFSKSDCKDQNSLDWKVHYILENPLKHRCLKMGLHDPFAYLKHKLWPKKSRKSN